MENNQEIYSKRITKAQLLCVSFGAILGSFLRMFCFTNIEGNPIIRIIIINIIGSVLFAIISQFENFFPKELRLFLLTGFCASFTTFSLTIAQAQVAAQSMDLQNYALALFGNFFLSLFFTIIAIFVISKIFKKAKGLN